MTPSWERSGVPVRCGAQPPDETPERLPREIALEEKTKTAQLRNVLRDASTPRRGRKNASACSTESRTGLPAEFREAVVLCELEEMSYEEAAQMAGARSGRFVRGCIADGFAEAKLEMFRDVPRRARAAR